MKPALTAEEWGGRLAFDAGSETVALAVHGTPFSSVRFVTTGAIVDTPSRLQLITARPHAWYGRPHALAALCLDGQPFGFTREDVTKLRMRAANCRESERWAADQMYPDKIRDAREAAELYESLADRIESLLPPEK